MGKRLMTAVLACGLALGAPTASADPYDSRVHSHSGDCGFFAVNNEAASSPGEFTGVIYVAIVSVVPVDGSCWIEVDGDKVDDTELSFSGPSGDVVADAMPILYQADEGQVVQLCWVINGSSDCAYPDLDFEFPPPEVEALIDEILELIDSVARIPDFILCPILASLYPVNVGPYITLDMEGDVHLNGIRIKDCPPYGS